MKVCVCATKIERRGNGMGKLWEKEAEIDAFKFCFLTHLDDSCNASNALGLWQILIDKKLSIIKICDVIIIINVL